MSDVAVEVDELSEHSTMTPEEQAWWTERREGAYQALVAGAPLGQVATQFGIDPRTLWNWRNHAHWQTRAAAEAEARANLLEEQLLGVDAAALDALHTHVARSAMVGFRYLQQRGLLTRPAADAYEKYAILLHDEVEILEAYHEGRVTITPPAPVEAPGASTTAAETPEPHGGNGAAEPLAPRHGNVAAPAATPSHRGLAAPEPLPSSSPAPALPHSQPPAPEPPPAPPRDLHVPYPRRLRTWERKLLEEGKLLP